MISNYLSFLINKAWEKLYRLCDHNFNTSKTLIVDEIVIPFHLICNQLGLEATSNGLFH